MYQSYPYREIQQQSSPWYNQPYLPQSIIRPQNFINPQYLSPPSDFVNRNHSNLNKDLKTFSNSKLIKLLDNHTNVLKKRHTKDQQQQLPILIDAINVLIRLPNSTLVSTEQNEFFSLLRASFTDILHQWCHRTSPLSDTEFFMFRATTKLVRRLIKGTDDIKLIPSWLSDSALLEAISSCLTNIATSGKFLSENNKHQYKSFTRLINKYTRYQQRLNDEDNSQNDKLVQLLDPILHCLTSSYFINIFENMPKDAKSMTTIEKFFLIKCPAFLTSYKGSRLEQTMKSLLSTMLPQYVQLLDKLVPSAHNWNRSMMRSVDNLLEMINHGADQFETNAKLISGHLSLIDNVLKLVNEPAFYNNLHETLSNLETILMNTAIKFLVNMISEPSILTHIKQCQVANSFLRLTSCKYEPLVLNIYTLLAYTTREEDIKAMQNPGRLFTTILKSLKTALERPLNDKNHIEQLLETLKGLVQHDQIKDEVIKQNALPFLFECANKLTDRAQILILEILWSLTFCEEGALALRSNRNFLDKIQTILKDGDNEPLKKAADGLVWKLIREPAFLEKVARQQTEEKNADNEVMETVIEEIIDSNGQKQLVTRVKPAADTIGERVFPYDIMISYCHADKELIGKLHKFLIDQGFKVWIDLDNMYGPAMSAMADAVENSEFVFLCMSDSYKQSTYCQAEAEYAFKCKRRLIPLIVRQGYKADGWLGFMIGSRIYVDYGRFDFETACEKLMTELSHQRKQPLPSKSAKINQHEVPTKTISDNQQIDAPPRKKSSVTYDTPAFSVYTDRKPMSNFIRKPLNQWTESDVLDFLFTQRLIQLMPLCEAMDGRTLKQLYKMCISRSSRMYILLDDELKSTYKMKLPLRIYTRFLSAMEERLTVRPPAPVQTKPKLPVTKVTTFPQEFISYCLEKSIAYNVPYPSEKSIADNVPLQYPSYPNKPYDLLITSDASAEEIIRTIQRDGLNFKIMPSILTQKPVRF